jgi:hypothetical protein
MKHPLRSDFHAVVTEAGVSVTFKPTNSVYCFCRLAPINDLTRLGPVSLAGVQHAGRNTEDYSSDEVRHIAQRIASEFAASVCFQERTDHNAQPFSLASGQHAKLGGTTKTHIASEVAATL